MNEMKAALLAGLAPLGLTESPGGAERLCRYGELLLEKNKVMNLTAITQPENVARLHFLDSLALFGVLPLAGKRVIDVGCGAGLPGLALRLWDESVRLTLLDSLAKRMTWLSEVCGELAPDVELITARAEEQARADGYFESYDVAVSRAVARLPVLAELCLPYVRVGGVFIAMKSADCDDEMDEAKRAVKLLGGRIRSGEDYAVPGTEHIHRAVVIEKLSRTPGGYPRKFAKIKQSPL